MSKVYDVIYFEQCGPYQEILAIHQNTATKEYDKLRLAPRSEINQFIQDETSWVVRATTVLIQRFRKLTTLQEV